MLAVYFDAVPTKDNLKFIQSCIEKEEHSPQFFVAATIPAKDIGYDAVQLEIDDVEKKKIEQTVLNKIVDFPNIAGGSSTLRSAYSVEGIDCWHYLKFRTYFKVKNIAYKQAFIKQLLKEYNRVIFVSTDSDLPEIKGCTFLNTIQSKKVKPNYKTIVKYGTFLAFRTFSYLLKSVRNREHIIVDCTLHRDYLGLDLKKKKGNYIIGYLLDSAPENFLVINKRELPKFNGESTFSFGLKDVFLTKNTIADEGIVMKAFLSFSIRKKVKNQLRKLKEQLDEINLNELSELEKNILKASRAFIPSVNIFLLQWHAYKAFFKKHPKLISISTTDENSPLQKSILDAAKCSGMFTIGIQHGAIFENHAAYRHSQLDIKKKVIPDYTMIWGEHTLDVLTNKCNYPEESLIKVGQVRTDIISRLTSSNFKHLLPEEFRGKKIVLFASQPQPDASLRYRAAEDVFKACKDQKNTLLVLKPHPAEIHNLEYYINIARNVDCKNLYIARELDLYLSLAASDLVITCYSTVGAEAIYFNKPLIILDHLKQDIQEYYKNGVAIRATNSNELEKHIQSILSKKEAVNTENLIRYINQYSYKIDGKASNRVFKFIRTLTERKKLVD